MVQYALVAIAQTESTGCMPAELRIFPVREVGEVHPGADLAELILAALARSGQALAPHDVLVVTQKIVSKAEGRIVDPAEAEPSHMATWPQRRAIKTRATTRWCCAKAAGSSRWIAACW